MRTNCILRKFSSFVVTPVALAVCLGALAGTPALAQGGDSTLQAGVSDAIAHDAMLKNQAITASVQHGIVTLTGTVETEQQRQQAETDAANVNGVSGIENNLTVTGSSDEQGPPPPPDESEQPAPAPSAQPAPQSDQIPPPPPPDQEEPPAQSAPPPPAARAPYPQGGYGQGGYGQQPYGGYGNYPPPQPVSGPVTVPAGTLLQIRLSEPLDLAKLQDGTVFQATDRKSVV